MSTNLCFAQKFASSIVNVLGCFDRVLFKGYLPFGGDGHLNVWVDGTLNMRRMDFLPLVEKQSNRLWDNAQIVSRLAPAPYLYLQDTHCKVHILQDTIRH